MTRANFFASRLLAVSGLGALVRRTKVAPSVVTLAYHRIGDGRASSYDHALWSATLEEFDAQVRFLRRHFDIIGPGDLEQARRKHGKFVLITFDDGYRDNYLHAFPILRSHNATATFFVSTGFLDRPHAAWWDEIAWMVRTSRRLNLPCGRRLRRPLILDEPDRERAVCTLLSWYKVLPGHATEAFLDDLAEATGAGRCHASDIAETWMTWDMIREMRRGGMTIGGHTVNHPILARLAREEQWREIDGCSRRLKEELREPMRWMSYPRGKPDAFNADTRACLARAGVELAFSYYGGYRTSDRWDRYDIPRSAIEMETTHEEFRAMVTLPQVFA